MLSHVLNSRPSGQAGGRVWFQHLSQSKIYLGKDADLHRHDIKHRVNESSFKFDCDADLVSAFFSKKSFKKNYRSASA